MAHRPALEISEDRWLSGIFNHEVFRVDRRPTWEDFFPESLRMLDAHAKGRGAVFYYAKVPAALPAVMRVLCSGGFGAVDVSVLFDRPAKDKALPRPEHRVEKIEGDGPLARAVVDIAGSCFKYSRFHMDPAVRPELAHRIKREWIANYVRGGRGDSLYAAMDGDDPVGFLAVIRSESEGRRSCAIDLVGVAGKAQGRGVGRSLTRFFVNNFRKSCDDLLVGTQAANVGSMRLYEGCGFRIRQTAYVLHKHI